MMGPLGAPAIMSVTSDSAGSATIMLTPGDDATKHYVWAIPTDNTGNADGMWSGEVGGEATMVEMTGLSSGKDYWFIPIAGQGDGADTAWEWGGWTDPAIAIQ